MSERRAADQVGQLTKEGTSLMGQPSRMNFRMHEQGIFFFVCITMKLDLLVESGLPHRGPRKI